MLDVCDLHVVEWRNQTPLHAIYTAMGWLRNLIIDSKKCYESMMLISVLSVIKYLSVVSGYLNTPGPQASTGEKPFFGLDCRFPTEATLLPPSALEPTEKGENMVISQDGNAFFCFTSHWFSFRTHHSHRGLQRAFWLCLHFRFCASLPVLSYSLSSQFSAILMLRQWDRKRHYSDKRTQLL